MYNLFIPVLLWIIHKWGIYICMSAENPIGVFLKTWNFFLEKWNLKNWRKFEKFLTINKKINPRGGLIGSGHPLGATGIAQVIETAQQLQGNAEKRQIENANIGLVHNMSAAATSSTVLLLQSWIILNQN